MSVEGRRHSCEDDDDDAKGTGPSVKKDANINRLTYVVDLTFLFRRREKRVVLILGFLCP